MAAEVAMIFAHAAGRVLGTALPLLPFLPHYHMLPILLYDSLYDITIFNHEVLPPKAKWYLLGKNRDDTDNESSFDTFFDLRKVRMGLFHTMLISN